MALKIVTGDSPLLYLPCEIGSEINVVEHKRYTNLPNCMCHSQTGIFTDENFLYEAPLVKQLIIAEEGSLPLQIPLSSHSPYPAASAKKQHKAGLGPDRPVYIEGHHSEVGYL
jgi:hypothetical protein